MVGTYPAGRADSNKTERRESSARIAGCALIVLDASAVVEVLGNGALAASLKRELVESGDLN
jgi:hypothetical protein